MFNLHVFQFTNTKIYKTKDIQQGMRIELQNGRKYNSLPIVNVDMCPGLGGVKHVLKICRREMVLHSFWRTI